MDLSQPLLFKLNGIISSALYEVKSLKNYAVKTEKYENSAKLREIELSLQKIRETLAQGLFPTLIKSPSANTKNYYDELFEFGFMKDWVHTSAYFKLALQNRKEELSKIFQFDEEHKKQLVYINENLNEIQNKVLDFVSNKAALAEVQLLAPVMDSIVCETVCIKFYPNNFSLTHIGWRNTTNSRNSFYQTSLPLNVLLENLQGFTEDSSLDYRSIRDGILKELSLKGVQHTLCPLFIFVMTSTHLAWEDILKVKFISLDIGMRYSVTV